jgi:hypothetical protein
MKVMGLISICEGATGCAASWLANLQVSKWTYTYDDGIEEYEMSGACRTPEGK